MKRRVQRAGKKQKGNTEASATPKCAGEYLHQLPEAGELNLQLGLGMS